MGIYHLIPQICMSTYNIPGATPCSELQNSKNLNSCPRGALSSGKKNRHEDEKYHCVDIYKKVMVQSWVMLLRRGGDMSL